MNARGAIVALLITAACTPSAPTVDDPDPTPSPEPSTPTAAQALFATANVVEIVRVLAGEIGPREATSPGFRRAADVVGERMAGFGYRVARQTFSVPAGVSGGMAVQPGETFNVVAEPSAFDPTRPHLVVGAHLDTVPQAPGAVDNAAGIGIVLELARLAAATPTPLPIVFVAFGAEEARVPHGGLFGSRRFVEELSAGRREALVGAIAVDRIGAGATVSVCTGAAASRAFAERLLAAAGRVGVPARSCTNRSSDHWSFEQAGLVAARLGPDEFPEYHTARDTPDVLVPEQVERAGTLLWEALRLMAPP